MMPISNVKDIKNFENEELQDTDPYLDWKTERFRFG